MASAKTPEPRPDADFKLSITRALADQLLAGLAELTPAPLTDGELDRLHRRPGVYELYHHGTRLYVGKASKSLPDRLRKHLKKLSGRTGFGHAIGFVCLYVDEDLEASAPEKSLIKVYRSEGGAPWNTNGFGNNDPGKRRDTSLVKANHFDALFPINLDLSLAVAPKSTGDSNVYTCLTALKKALPYLLRFDKDRSTDLRAAKAAVPPTALTLREWMMLTVGALPVGWQATALPGYVILYEEPDDPDRYLSALAYWRKDSDGLVKEFVGQGRMAPEGDVDQDVEDAADSQEGDDEQDDD